ncbi:Uncharacterised protein [Vibrio cholerae]|nr:Uncharacterised protein [Vibrio cholerae]
MRKSWLPNRAIALKSPIESRKPIANAWERGLRSARHSTKRNRRQPDMPKLAHSNSYCCAKCHIGWLKVFTT